MQQIKGKKMGKTIRLTCKEMVSLEIATLEINRELIKRGKQPVKDTELFHRLAEQVIEKGKITLNADNRAVLELD